MKAIKSLSMVLHLLIVAPIWYWLIYQILLRVNATELMWFLYWVYVPFGLIATACVRLIESQAKS